MHKWKKRADGQADGRTDRHNFGIEGFVKTFYALNKISQKCVGVYKKKNRYFL